MASPLSAANAYASLAKLTDPTARVAKTIGEAGESGESFGGMLKDALNSVVDAGRKSDAQTRSVATGKSNIVDVVTAVSETEVAIDAVVAVRDRVIQAYEDVMKMAI